MKAAPSFSFWQFVSLELAPYPGRDKAVFRFLVVNALVITLSMTFQVPFMALSLIMTFFTARENTVLTRITGIIMMLGGTLGIGASLLLLKVSFDYPLIRIVLAAFIMFAGMYFFRISKLGNMGFILTILVSYSQSLVDIIADPETLVRMILWAWVAAIYPIVITLLVNTLMFPASPEVQLKRVSLNIIDIILSRLDMQQVQNTSGELTTRDVARLTLSLQQCLTFSLMSGDKFKEQQNRYIQHVGGIERLLNMAMLLPEYNEHLASSEEHDLRRVLQMNSMAFRQAILDEKKFIPPISLSEHYLLQNINNEALKEMSYVFIELEMTSENINNKGANEQNGPTPFFVPDAWTNPDYARFAVKCILATLLCYVFYSAVDWPGIHTAMLTCIILALPSVGAITHKGILRLIGCVLGSAAALFVTVFIVPYLDSIVGLLLASLPIIAMSAWISSGSEKSNYIGVQMAFAFALSMFDQFGPTVSLTEIRDRMVGVLLGIAISTFIYSYLWPERDSQRLNATMGQFLKLLAKMITLDNVITEPEKRTATLASMRIKGWQLLAQCEELLMRIKLEPVLGHKPHHPIPDISSWLTTASDILITINQLQLSLDVAGRETIEPLTKSVTEYLNVVADAHDSPQRPQVSFEHARENIEHNFLLLKTSNQGKDMDTLQNLKQYLYRLSELKVIQ